MRPLRNHADRRQGRRIEALLQQYSLNGPELRAIDARYAELEDNKMALEEAAVDPPAGIERLPRERYWELRTQIDQEQEQLQRRRVMNCEVEPLKVALRNSWTEASWQARPLEWRRAIIRLVTERIEVHKPTVVVRRGRVGGQFDPERVRIKVRGVNSAAGVCIPSAWHLQGQWQMDVGRYT